MRHAHPRIVRSLAAAAIAALGLAALSSAAPAAQAAGTGVVDCAGAIVTKPQDLTISCADANLSISKISWKSWTNNRARGTGTLVWNTCLPQTCVDGIVQRYPVNITLRGVASGGNVSVFSRLTVVFPKASPAGLISGQYLLDNPIKS